MSIHVMSNVWQKSQHTGAHLLMMLAIADFADDQGRAYPAVSTLAGKCRVKARAANYTIADLRDSGELEVKVARGPRGANLYRIVLDQLGVLREAVAPLQPAAPLHRVASLQSVAGGGQLGAPLQSSAPLQPGARTPAPGCTPPLHPGAAKPSLNHQEPSVEAIASVGKADLPASRGTKKLMVSLKTWIGALNGEQAIPADDAVFVYAEQVGLSAEFLELAWKEFLARYSEPDAKRYRDWRAVFRKAVRANWLKLWYATGDGSYALTTAGTQAQRAWKESA